MYDLSIQIFYITFISDQISWLLMVPTSLALKTLKIPQLFGNEVQTLSSVFLCNIKPSEALPVSNMIQDGLSRRE